MFCYSCEYRRAHLFRKRLRSFRSFIESVKFRLIPGILARFSQSEFAFALQPLFIGW